jgi:hypothetical protein
MPPRESYETLIEAKRSVAAPSGFEPIALPSGMFDFQRYIADRAIRLGRSAIFGECGLGKTLMELAFADNVVRKTNGRVLLLTPLSVGPDVVREGERFGIEAHISRNGKAHPGITVANYQRLHRFDPADFDGIALDESSILKSFDGPTSDAITEFMKRIPYRLLASATQSPNDFTELGNASEALGYLGLVDYLNRYYANAGNNSNTRRFHGKGPAWRFRAHAERPHWRYVASWATAARRPSDLGFEDGPYLLPELRINRRIVESDYVPEGMLFNVPSSHGLDRGREKKGTIRERCEAAAKLVDHGRPAAVWCQLDKEADMLECMIPGAIQVSGKHGDEEREERFGAFQSGQARVMITKPRIGAWGLNWQHCDHVVYFPTDSYEEYHQAVRRCWRFGQTRPVTVDLVMSEGESLVMDNLAEKERKAQEMFDRLVSEIHSAERSDRLLREARRMEVPQWLS